MRDLKQQGTGVTPSSRGQAMSPDHDVKQQRLFRTPSSRGKLRHQAPENRMDSGGRGQIGLQAVKVIQDSRRQRTVGTSNSSGKGHSLLDESAEESRSTSRPGRHGGGCRIRFVS